MSKVTFIQNGDCIDFTNTGAAIAYHDVVPLVGRVGIAQNAIPVGGTESLCVCGTWEFPAVNDTAFAVGDTVYWDAVAQKVTKTAAGNTRAGWCVTPKLTAGTTAQINIELGA